MSQGLGDPIPSSSISLFHLARLDPSKVNEFAEALRNTLYSDNYADFATGLRDDEAKIFINFLDKALDSIYTDPELFYKCLRALRAICSQRGQLPSSYNIPECLLIREGEHPIASGGFSDVWAGTFGQRKVALKCLKMSSKEELTRIWKALCKEVVVWKRLSHPNILPLLGVSTIYSRVCMVADRMGHGHVMEYLSTYPNKSRLALLSDVAEGLGYMHSFRVVHGDLKGQNILIDDLGHARLADFGLNSITTDELSFNASAVNPERGTARWIAPELLNTDVAQTARPSKESDIYSLAMVAIEIFTGQVPFPELSHNTVILKTVNGARPPRPEEARRLGLSDKVWEMIKKCWQQDPGKRPNVSVVLDCFKNATVAHAALSEVSATSGICTTQSAPNLAKLASTSFKQPTVFTPASRAGLLFLPSYNLVSSPRPGATSPVLPVVPSATNLIQTPQHPLSRHPPQDNSRNIYHRSASSRHHRQEPRRTIPPKRISLCRCLPKLPAFHSLTNSKAKHLHNTNKRPESRRWSQCFIQ